MTNFLRKVACMIEIHSHILPGLDDGSRTNNETLEMARIAVEQGITDVIATPHHADGTYYTPTSIVEQSVQVLNALLTAERLPLTIHVGQEIRVHQNLLDEWERKIVSTLAGSRYMLLELPAGYVPKYLNDLIYELSLRGVVPVIAHPERNKEIYSSPALLASLIEQGALCQITSHSLTGLFGRKIQKLSFLLCRSKLIHFVSSDAHNCYNRSFALRRAYQMLSKTLGSEMVEQYRANTLRLLNNQEIKYPEPIKLRRKLLFW